jgi:ribosomal protein S18 acetylase RimI-like enzyme
MDIKYYKTKFNKLKPKEIDEMKNIWKYCFDTIFDWYGYSNILLAKKDDNVIGFVGYLTGEQLKLWLRTKDLLNEIDNYGYVENGLYIYNLGVDLSFRKNKIGSKLIKFLIKMKKDLYLWVDIYNLPAINLYVNLGFKIDKKLNVYNKKIYILRYIY